MLCFEFWRAVLEPVSSQRDDRLARVILASINVQNMTNVGAVDLMFDLETVWIFVVEIKSFLFALFWFFFSFGVSFYVFFRVFFRFTKNTKKAGKMKKMQKTHKNAENP